LDDWVWVNKRLGRFHGALTRHLQLQLQRLFKIKLQNEDETFFLYWLSLKLTTIPENSGNLDPVSKFVQVRNEPAAGASQVFSVENIVGCAHLFPQIANANMTGY
jgi:hypothetical protein